MPLVAAAAVQLLHARGEERLRAGGGEDFLLQHFLPVRDAREQVRRVLDDTGGDARSLELLHGDVGSTPGAPVAHDAVEFAAARALDAKMREQRAAEDREWAARAARERAALDAVVDAFENKIGPRNGARVVARAWVDPEYKKRLLADGGPAIAELGYTGEVGEHLKVVENTPQVHNLVVCTLCSCYPWPVLGLPPVWYKSAPYRSRAVIDPRGVMREFGLEGAYLIERLGQSTLEGVVLLRLSIGRFVHVGVILVSGAKVANPG